LTQSAKSRALSQAEAASLTAVKPVAGPLDRAIHEARQWLIEKQDKEGFWVGMLESNSTMEAQWVLAMHFLGVEDDPKYDGVVKSILQEQRQDGAWDVYHDAPQGDINTTVECYAALRSSGMSPDAPQLVKAREWIFAHGGLKNVRNFTRYWLALIGEWPWDETPTLPPELILLPAWAPFNIYQFASWARGTIVPLCVLSARRPVRRLPPDRRLDELFPDGRENFDFSLPRAKRWVSWEGLFLRLDRLLSAYVPMKLRPGREAAIRLCIEWIVKRQEADGAWSGIQPPWIYSLMALRVEGFSLRHPVIRAGLDAFDKHWSYQRDGAVYLQASESPVWDTILSMLAMLDCQPEPELTPAMREALNWLLDQQIKAWGDWKVYVRDVRGGGWAFQRANAFYPDVDDTAVALIVLARLRDHLSSEDRRRVDEAIDLAVEWMLAMQSESGGWGAFDRDNDKWLLTKIPFADFGELLDPPSVDVTAHVVEALACLGYGRSHPAVAKALDYIRTEQEPEGSWFGRWGVNHIYGTAAVLPALEALGEDMNRDYVRRAADWLVSHQNPDGGWGETPASYIDDSLRGVGESTSSQTGWALMALAATGSDGYASAIRRGIDCLISTQKDGTWDEPHYTGTGFPGYSVGERVDLKEEGERLRQGIELQRAFMINYTLYRHYFPMMGLGRARRWLARHHG
jgi:squalene-hopene/tetraprenyl-beta-curcumene cyclase